MTLCIFTNGLPSIANAQTAGDVVTKMNADQRLSYVSGVVEGLAYSRWLRDKPSAEGMNCVYDWYYKGAGKDWNGVVSWFERHPDKPVGALLYVLIKKDCGE